MYVRLGPVVAGGSTSTILLQHWFTYLCHHADEAQWLVNPRHHLPLSILELVKNKRRLLFSAFFFGVRYALSQLSTTFGTVISVKTAPRTPSLHR